MAGARFAFHTLGCPKNEADSAALERRLSANGHRLVAENEADLVIVNTCGFIDAAKEESIDALLAIADECHRRGALTAAMGCLVARYRDELQREMPEIDVWTAFDDDPLLQALANLSTSSASQAGGEGRSALRRPPLPLHAYVKISDGCDRHCAYCAIPLIKGRYEVISPDIVLAAAQQALAAGARELVLVGQDTSRWKWDGYGGLPRLLADLAALQPLWLRMLYLQPDGVDERLLTALAAHSVPYLDLPLQHASPTVLRRMGRSGDADGFLALLERVRRTLPGVAVRSTFIAGFPGESEQDTELLGEFIEAAALAVAGVFVFDPQEGTPAAGMTPVVPYEVAMERAARLSEIVDRTTSRFWSSLAGHRLDVLVESGTRRPHGEAIGRIHLQAPDVDGVTVVSGAGPVRRGQVVRAVVDGASGYQVSARALPARGETEGGLR